MYRICSAPRAPSWPAGLLAVALALTTAPVALGAPGSHDPTLLRSAGWHGREMQEPLPAATVASAVGWPRGWSAGAVRPGTGHARADGSRRVRELQRRLRRRGYRPGPVDGRFGPRTRSALVWFQIKHGLPQTGTVDVHTLATIRSRPARAERAAIRPPTVGPARVATTTLAAVGRTTADRSRIAPAVLAALLALACAVALRSTVRRARDVTNARPEPRAARPAAASGRRSRPRPGPRGCWATRPSPRVTARGASSRRRARSGPGASAPNRGPRAQPPPR